MRGGGASILGLTRNLGRKVAGKPADLVHEGGLNSSSGQEEELAIGSSGVQQSSSHLSCCRGVALALWSLKADERTPCRRHPAHSAHSIRRATLVLQFQETNSSRPDGTRWQRKQKLPRLQAHGIMNAGDRRTFGGSGAGTSGPWYTQMGESGRYPSRETATHPGKD